MTSTSELVLAIRRLEYGACSSVLLAAAVACFATTITCSPSKRLSFVRRSAAFECAGVGLGEGESIGTGD